MGGEQGRGWLEKEERFGRNVVAEFGGVVAIVTPDADDLRRGDGGKEMEVAEEGGAEVGGQRGIGAGDEVFLRGLHGKGRPEDADALLD
jgi:hypothetical protein